MAGSTRRQADEIKELERELREKSLSLVDLELTIEDYRGEKARLLEELKSLRERLFDLTDQPRRPRNGSGTNSD